MMDIEKYENEKGQVAVLVSSGYGAGWSTWNGHSQFLAMDKGLVELKLSGAPESVVKDYCQKKTGEAPYMGGWKDVEVEWVRSGSSVRIHDYDESESIRFGSEEYMTA
jgi:hypothetical protein